MTHQLPFHLQHTPEKAVARLRQQFLQTRQLTAQLCEPLTPEDCVVQSMEDASPAKWNIAHTSWFFEVFILAEHAPNYSLFHPRYPYLFNSYYNTMGQMHPRFQRGLLNRPPMEDVLAYRQHVNEAMVELLDTASPETLVLILPLVEIGIHHEQQHQELLLTDIKHVFACNPLRPAYREIEPLAGDPGPMEWIAFEGGIHEIGHDEQGFGFDHEFPRHQTFLHPFLLADRLVTNGEYIAFIEDGGYENLAWWLSDGWATVSKEGWDAPFYWEQVDGAWHAMTLGGFKPVDKDAPVCHVSSYEADAFAKWSGARLPTEHEWEVAAADAPIQGNFLEHGTFHPVACHGPDGTLRQVFGDTWEWTASPYIAYPGYRPPTGALGEYNGKFMCNQMVLRGGSCATPESHIRRTYRNFFHPDRRWQFTGIRLAKDA